MEKIGRLTREIEGLKGVTSANSLTEGLRTWRTQRRVPSGPGCSCPITKRSSNVVVFVSEEANFSKLIAHMEVIEQKLEGKDFHIQMAGAPYIAEMMRRSLKHDFETFSLTSFCSSA